VRDPTQPDQIIIVGAGGFGREVRDLATDAGLNVRGFLDDAPREVPPLHVPVLGTPAWDGEPDVPHVIAVGAPAAKAQLSRTVEGSGRTPAQPLVHPTVQIGRDVSIGDGAIVTAGCILTTNITIGRHVILNLGCTVGHDALIGDYVSAMPGVHISGNVSLGSGVFLGTNSAILEGVTVGDGATVGAGAVVTADVPPDTTVVGVPARPLARRAP
jgi:sugar O-acyltransferase (sialic acid O-acetyltransferase NeuD family)